ncbi:MAG: hypothetical protein DLM69_12115, partial [Candidatus Chloroheliales bacterium]
GLKAALWLLPLGFCLALLLMYPIGSGDIMDYINHGWLLGARGLNPLIVSPASVADNPFLKYSSGFMQPSSYGPLWELLGAGIVQLARVDLWTNLLAFKALAILSYFASAALIFILVRRRQPGWAWRALVFFLWNPLVLFDLAANGHNDALMLTGILLAFLALEQSWPLAARYSGASVALALGTLIKAPAALLLPLFWLDGWRRMDALSPARRVSALGLSIVVVAVLLLTFYLPFANGGSYSPLTMLQSRTDLFTTSIPNALKMGLQGGGMAVAQAATIARNLALAAFALFYLWQMWQLGQGRTTLRQASFEVMFFLLLFSTLWFQPWYVVWLVALAALLPAWSVQVRALVFSLTAMAKYVVWWMLLFWLFGNNRDVTQWASVYIIFTPPLLISLGFIVYHRLQGTRSLVGKRGLDRGGAVTEAGA